MSLQLLYQIDHTHYITSLFSENEKDSKKALMTQSPIKNKSNYSGNSTSTSKSLTSKRTESQSTIYSDTAHVQYSKEIIIDRIQITAFDLFSSNNYDAFVDLFNDFKYNNSRKPDINWRYGEEHNTFLNIAIERADVELINLLLGLNCDIEAKNGLGRSPLHLATLNHNMDIIDLLVSSGANVNSQDNEKNTPLMLATIRDSEDLVEYYLVHDADITLENRYCEYATDMIKSLKVLQIYQRYISDDTIKQYCTSYSKIVLHNPLKKYSRRDMIEKLLYKGRMVNDLIKNSSSFFKKKSEDTQGLTLKSMNLKDMIGKGGFGEVFKASFNGIDGEYAVKIINKDKVMHSRTNTSMALTERSILEKAHSPFIVQFYKAFQSSSHLYLVMEYLPHGDLKSYLRNHPNTLREEDIRMIAAQLILAIEHLHIQNIIYRDLKPENVMLDKDGYVKLIDFDLCKDNSKDNEEGKRCHSFCGTVAYLAPDLFNDNGYNRTIDWYHLGVVLYEMICGYPPYYSTQGKDAIIHNILHERLLFNNEINISEDLMDLITSLLERNSDRRLGSGISDSDEIKAHPFFKRLNFDKIFNKQFIPSSKLIANNKETVAVTSSWNNSNNDKNACNRDRDLLMENYVKGWDF